MKSVARERVTVDLRGLGPGLRAFAATYGKTTAAVVRSAVITLLDAETPPTAPQPLTATTAEAVKVTVRLPAVYALRLARFARSADVSQSAFIAGLLDGTPPPARSLDHGRAVTALSESTQRVAAMSSDINAFLRLIKTANGEGAERFRATLSSLSRDVRAHLALASELMSDLTSSQRSRAPRSPTSRRERLIK